MQSVDIWVLRMCARMGSTHDQIFLHTVLLEDVVLTHVVES